jgi:hypothetical protein
MQNGGNSPRMITDLGLFTREYVMYDAGDFGCLSRTPARMFLSYNVISSRLVCSIIRLDTFFHLEVLLNTTD